MFDKILKSNYNISVLLLLWYVTLLSKYKTICNILYYSNFDSTIVLHGGNIHSNI